MKEVTVYIYMYIYNPRDLHTFSKGTWALLAPTHIVSSPLLRRWQWIHGEIDSLNPF